MRLKSFSAATIAAAMRQIRQELGDEAIIVSTQTGDDGRGVRVTAAVEMPEAEDELSILLSNDSRHQLIARIGEALSFHGVQPTSAGALIATAEQSAADDAIAALADALKARYRFAPLTVKSITRPLLLVGPPGAGKTVTAAKLAMRAILAKRPVKVITTDNLRAGAVDQLAAFTSILETDLHPVESVAELRKLVAEIPPETFAVIDTAGVNPFSTGDMSTLSRMVEGDLVEPILITPGGGDVDEAAEAGEAFRTLGIRRMAFTRLDMARRLGALLTTAEAGDFAFSEVSISPHIARGLRPLSALALSRLLMRDPNKAQTQHTRGEAAQ